MDDSVTLNINITEDAPGGSRSSSTARPRDERGGDRSRAQQNYDEWREGIRERRRRREERRRNSDGGGGGDDGDWTGFSAKDVATGASGAGALRGRLAVGGAARAIMAGGGIAVGASAAAVALSAAAAAAWSYVEAQKAAKDAIDFSPAVAAAATLNERDRLFGKAQQAQEIGPELARFLRAQSGLEEDFRELKTAILSQALPAITVVLELLGEVSELAVTLKEFLGKDGLSAASTGFIEGILGALGIPPFVTRKVIGELGEYLARKNAEADKDILDNLLDLQRLLDPRNAFMQEDARRRPGG